MQRIICLLALLHAGIGTGHAADLVAKAPAAAVPPAPEDRLESGAAPSMAFGLAVLALARRRLGGSGAG